MTYNITINEKGAKRTETATGVTELHSKLQAFRMQGVAIKRISRAKVAA